MYPKVLVGLLALVSLVITGLTVTNPACGREFVAPDFSEKSLNLEGVWKFSILPEADGLTRGWHKPGFDDTYWIDMNVPGAWEDQGVTVENNETGWPDFKPYGGCAWYRKVITIPAEWKGYDLLLEMEKIDDQDITYWNGVEIGRGDNVDFQRRYLIPSGSVHYGRNNIIAIDVLDSSGDGGLTGGDYLIRPRMPWEGTEISGRCTDPLALYGRDEPVGVDVRIETDFDGKIIGTLNYKVVPFLKEPVVEGSIPLMVSVSEPWKERLYFPPLPPDHYELQVEYNSNGWTIAEGKMTWAVLEPLPEYTGPMDEYRLALGGGALFHIDIKDIPERGHVRLAQQRLAGALWGRNDIWRETLEPRKEEFSWNKSDLIINMFRGHDLQLLGIIGSTTGWNDSMAPVTAELIDDFNRYVRILVNRYKDRIKYWEAWNEPNAPDFWRPAPDVNDYVNYLKAVYPAVKEADPEARLVAGGTSHIDFDFIEEICKKAPDSFDVLSIHPYQWSHPDMPGRDVDRITDLVRLMKEYGLDQPVWVTECGWQTKAFINPAIQAEFMLKFYFKYLAVPEVERIYYFNLSDWGERGTGEGGQFGLMYMDQTPKPSYVAYHTLARFYTLYGYEGPADIGGRGIVSHCLNKKEGVYVVWAKQDPEKPESEETRSINLASRDLKVYDFLGRPVEVKKKNRTTVRKGLLKVGRTDIYEVKAGRMPMYVVQGQ